jgi:hypothetical protein
VREWKLCGLQYDLCEGLEALWLTKSWQSLRGSSDSARLFGATWSSKIPCSSPTSRDAHCWQIWQKQSFEGEAVYSNRRFRCAWHTEQPIEVPEREERPCRRASERYRKATISPKQMWHKAILQPLLI